jgi:hypothetical protein
MARIILLLVIHLFADYIFQGSKMSSLKRLKNSALIEHVGIYTLIFIILSPFALGLTFIQGLQYSLLNGALHFGIDYGTGRLKKYFLSKDNESKYLTVIGMDYTVHFVILILTYVYLFPHAYHAIVY